MRLIDEGRKNESIAGDALVGHQHFCEKCRTIKHMSIRVGTENDAVVLQMLCRSCKHKVTFIYTVDGWIPASVVSTIETFAIARLAKAVEDHEEKVEAEAKVAGETKEPEKPKLLSLSRFHLPVVHLPKRRKETKESETPTIVGGAPEEIPASEAIHEITDEEIAETRRIIEEHARLQAAKARIARPAGMADRIKSVRTLDDALALSKGDARIARRVLAASERIRLAAMEEL